MQGYFQDPDATDRAFDGGYFHSGDLAVWHSDGSIHIQDRSKDIIISGGEVRTVVFTGPAARQSIPVYPKKQIT
jgi:non-ribosomal peptide synthetase component E (peptide arylation enzyme)